MLFELLLKDFGRCQIAESFSRTIVESVDMEFKDRGWQIGQLLILWQKLTQQAVGVFIGSTLPGTIGIRKVDSELQTPRQRFMLRELRSVIDRYTLPRFFRDRPKLAFGRPVQADRSLVAHAGGHQISAASIHKRGHVTMMITPHNRVAFPVTNAAAGIDH